MKISLLPTVGNGWRSSWSLFNPKICFFMRVSLFLWVSMAVSLQLAAFDTNGQSIDQIEVTLEFKNAKLADVLTKIQNETKINFIYTPDQVDAITNINLARQRRTVKNLLETVLNETLLTYKEVDGTVVLFKKKKLTSEVQGMVDPVTDIPKYFLVTGKVTDPKTGEPLPAVNVIVKGTGNGTSTDKNGIYSISVENDNDVLVFSFIGFKSYEIVVNGRTLIDVALESDLQELKEVVINAGYYDVTDREKTGSISKVSSSIIQRQPVNDPMLALQGRVPGLVIEQTSGKPGSNVRISLRGKNSIQNGVEPFYIVDGVPFSSQSLGGTNSGVNGVISPFYSLSPNDIESIEILKDADATAIYGSRGANGVIIITTKRGKKGKAKLAGNISYGTSRVADFLDLMDTKQYLKMRHRAFKNDNRVIGPTHYDINGVWDSTRYTDWQKEFIGGTASMINAQASVSGGSESTNYFFSGSIQKQTTVFPGDNDSKTGSLLFSISNESPNDKFKSRFSTNYVINSMNAIAGDLTSTALTLAPDAPALYQSNGELNWENSTWQNPLAFTKSDYSFSSYNLITNVFLSYEIIPGLNIKSSFGINNVSRDEYRTSPSTIYDPSWGIGPEESMVFSSSGTNRTWIAEPQISWQSVSERMGKFSVLIGGTLQSQVTNIESFKYQDFPSNSLINDPNSARLSDVEGYSTSKYKYSAAFGRINYTFKNKYIINLTGRRDGSSRFGPGKQFANLGAIGAAWMFSDEAFFKQLTVINLGKLRGSFGLTGNDQIGDYQFLDTYQSYSPYNGGAGIVPARLYNSDYSWETTKKLELAIEMAMFDSRISLTTAYYNNRSSNQLINYRVGATSGFPSVLKNFPAKIENSGLEVELQSVNLQGDLKWTTSINITVPRNRLVDFPGLEGSSYSNTYVKGKSLSIVKLLKYSGIDPVTGLYTFEDMNNDGAITIADQLFVKELQTRYFGGVNNTFTYKGWTLDVFWQFVDKNAVNPLNAFYYPGRQYNQPKDILDNDWESEGDGSKYQRFSTNRGDVSEAYQNYLQSDQAIVSASFLRLKNVALSYKIPDKWSSKIDATLYVHGQNLLTITSYDGLDPETGTSSVLPTLRTIILGARMSF